MKKLIENELFGAGLLPVEQKLLINRYNNCLKDIGIKETKLPFFHIDKWGWSPEIAQEFKNKDYLCFGYANPFGIIITPEQKNGAVYNPFHSFDRDLLDAIYLKYNQQITDITTQYGLWFEINQEISTYRKPTDFLKINSLEIKFYTPSNIVVAAQEQKKLVEEFTTRQNAWANKQLHIELLTSAEKYGDLRNRNFEIYPFQYNHITHFYTRIFGGLFVLKPNNSNPLLIYQTEEAKDKAGLNNNHIPFSLTDSDLIDYLLKIDFIKNDLTFFKTDIFSIITLKDNLLISLVAEYYPNENIDITTERQKSKYIHLLSQDNKLPTDFFALEEIINSLSKNESPDIKKYPTNVQIALSYPNPKFDMELKKLIWKLLSKISPLKDVLIQYLFDKEQFYTDYQSWNEYKKDWGIKLIKDNKYQMYNYKLNKE